jgi:putative ABC transport system substrate-binding protein
LAELSELCDFSVRRPLGKDFPPQVGIAQPLALLRDGKALERLIARPHRKWIEGGAYAHHHANWTPRNLRCQRQSFRARRMHGFHETPPTLRVFIAIGEQEPDRTTGFLGELFGSQPDIIVVTGSTVAAVALQRETQTIPIVFMNLADPIATGIVPRLDRPSGNVTGFVSQEATLGGKWLEMLLEIAPGLKRVGNMFNPDTAPALAYMRSLETAARSLKIELVTKLVHSDAEIEEAIVDLGHEPGGGLVVMPDVFVAVHRAPIILAAARHNVPAVYTQSFYARDGGLLSYGVDGVDQWRRAATYVDSILRGAKPGDLPVQFPTKFEMAVNLKTAKALGLTVPQSILLRADEVIE